MRSSRLILYCLWATLSVVGCGAPPAAPVEPTEPVAEASSEEPAAPAPAPRPVFDSTDLDQVARVYARVRAGDVRAFADAGLNDEQGLPDPTKLAKYYAAVEAAGRDDQSWKRFELKVAREARQ